MICLSVAKNALNTAFELVFKMHTLLSNGLDKVLCRMRKSLIFATLNEVNIIFGKESFINTKKVLNFIQSLTTEKKIIKSLTAFHRVLTREYRHFQEY